MFDTQFIKINLYYICQILINSYSERLQFIITTLKSRQWDVMCQFRDSRSTNFVTDCTEKCKPFWQISKLWWTLDSSRLWAMVVQYCRTYTDREHGKLLTYGSYGPHELKMASRIVRTVRFVKRIYGSWIQLFNRWKNQVVTKGSLEKFVDP